MTDKTKWVSLIFALAIQLVGGVSYVNGIKAGTQANAQAIKFNKELVVSLKSDVNKKLERIENKLDVALAK